MSKVEFDYYYGAEAEQFTFIRVPRIFFTDKEHFGTLSTDTKILYSLLLERMSLSRKNNWIDEENRVFIIFKIDEIADKLNCGHEKACNILKELDDESGMGLISKRRRGMGQPAIIYVKNFIVKGDQPTRPQEETKNTESPESQEVGKSESNYIENNYTEKSYI
ncbi:MAG: replication initiator protein A, partial [Oscillospiraceae bacterium]|nr:replication initiator protein A [Oscillospiraceae bacterium]